MRAAMTIAAKQPVLRDTMVMASAFKLMKEDSAYATSHVRASRLFVPNKSQPKLVEMFQIVQNETSKSGKYDDIMWRDQCHLLRS